jgi:hypothetical protein
VPDPCLEADLGGLEGVVGGEDEEELELATLRRKTWLVVII